MSDASRRTFELATAVGIALFGAVIAVDSTNHDIGWQANGPASGYFPFRVGTLLVLTSTLVFVQSARAAGDGPFVTPGAFGRSLSVFWPTALLVAGMFALGCYVPSVIYLTWMMRTHGGYGWPRSSIGALVIVALLFLIFERWFQVPLAKGPVEAALGLY